MTNGDKGGRDLSFLAFAAIALIVGIGVLLFVLYGRG